METKLYRREVTKREAINRFGKLGYVNYVEYVRTEDPAPFNYRKQHKFRECTDPAGYLMCTDANKVYARKVEY